MGENTTAYDEQGASVLAEAFELVIHAWAADASDIITAMNGRTPLSQDRLRAELLILRLFSSYFGCRVALGGTNELSQRVIGTANILHTMLVEGSGSVLSHTGLDESSVANYQEFLEITLDAIRSGRPDEYRTIEEMRIIAPTFDALSERLGIYSASIVPDNRDGSVAMIGLQFAGSCETPFDDVAKSIGERQFMRFAADAVEQIKGGDLTSPST